MNAIEYNPLDYANLTRNCVVELMRRGPFKLPLTERFVGSGVYALFYCGNSKLYAKVKSEDASWPVYVGKAVPPGGRKGSGALVSRALYSRIGQHTASIEAANNLRIEDFVCRYLVVTPLWITMAERFLIEHYKPIWNVCIEGFGNHNPGAGRHEGETTWWDVLHPGRAWATRLKQAKTAKDGEERLRKFLASYQKRSLDEVLVQKPGDEKLAELGPISEDE